MNTKKAESITYEQATQLKPKVLEINEADKYALKRVEKAQEQEIKNDLWNINKIVLVSGEAYTPKSQTLNSMERVSKSLPKNSRLKFFFDNDFTNKAERTAKTKIKADDKAEAEAKAEKVRA